MIGLTGNSTLGYPSTYGSGIDGPSASVWSPVAAGATTGETQDAIDDSRDEGIVTSFGGAPPDSPTYNAAGLLNSFVQAGTPLADVDSTGPYGPGDDSGLASGVQAEDGAVLDAGDADGTPGAAPGGHDQSVWVNTLQANPSMAGTVAGDALDQGLVSTLSVMA